MSNSKGWINQTIKKKSANKIYKVRTLTSAANVLGCFSKPRIRLESVNTITLQCRSNSDFYNIMYDHKRKLIVNCCWWYILKQIKNINSSFISFFEEIWTLPNFLSVCQDLDVHWTWRSSATASATVCSSVVTKYCQRRQCDYTKHFHELGQSVCSKNFVHN